MGVCYLGIMWGYIPFLFRTEGVGVAVALAVQATCGKADLEVRVHNACRNPRTYGGFPKIRCIFLGSPFGVPITRTIVVLGLFWGPLILGNHPIPPCLVEAVNEIPLPRAERALTGLRWLVNLYDPIW